MSEIINRYKDLYSLPEFNYQEKVDFNFFRNCKKDHKFLIICIYNEKREFLVRRDFNKGVGWELIGGYLKDSERIEDGINRIVKRETGLSIDELCPIAIVNNNFKWKDRFKSHNGMVFTALARGDVKPQENNIKTIYTKKIPEKMAYQNEKILKRAKDIIENKSFQPPFEELKKNSKTFFFHYFNKYIMSFFGQLSSRKIKNKIFEFISINPDSVLDVACGDDDLIFKLKKKFNLEKCVANDISWRTISIIKDKDKSNEIIFTNHNLLEIPLQKKFDLVIFKNTLHHIPENNHHQVLQSLFELTDELIIVDVHDPNRSTILARLWHWYYSTLLDDKGHNFLTTSEFKEKLQTVFKGVDKEVDIIVDSIGTIKGEYFFGKIKRKKEKKEVEMKVSIDKDQLDALKRKLNSLNAKLQTKVKETDIYFTAPHRDFIKTKECLRIRSRGDYKEVTYKGKSTNLMEETGQFWKKEIDIPFNASIEEMKSFFTALNFEEVSTVKKSREKYYLKGKKITIDEVENAGLFMEIEAEVIDEDKDDALVTNMEILQDLNIDKQDIVKKPYRDLVLEKNQE